MAVRELLTLFFKFVLTLFSKFWFFVRKADIWDSLVVLLFCKQGWYFRFSCDAYFLHARMIFFGRSVTIYANPLHRMQFQNLQTVFTKFQNRLYWIIKVFEFCVIIFHMTYSAHFKGTGVFFMVCINFECYNFHIAYYT